MKISKLSDTPLVLSLTLVCWLALRRVLADALILGPEVFVRGVAGSNGMQESLEYLACGRLSGDLHEHDEPQPLKMGYGLTDPKVKGLLHLLAGEAGVLVEDPLEQGYTEEQVAALTELWELLTGETWEA